MVINTNIAALNGANNLNKSTNMLNASLARLSSGSKIVNASDDPAGLAESITLGASINRTAAARPLLLTVYSSADSFPYTSPSIISPHMGDIVRGQPARFASFDTRPCEVPPDWRGSYRAPWTYQKEEEDRVAAE